MPFKVTKKTTEASVDTTSKNQDLESYGYSRENLEAMPLKTELRPIAREMINDALDEGLIDKQEASYYRENVKRAKKSQVMDDYENLLEMLVDKIKGNKPELDDDSSSDDTSESSDSSSDDTSADSDPSSDDTTEDNESSSDETSPPSMDDIKRLIDEAVAKGAQPSADGTSDAESDDGLIEHWQMPALMKLLEVNNQALIVGGAGSGKTTVAKQCAQKLGFDVDKEFFSISMSAGVSEAHLTGRMTLNGDFVDTKFLNIVEDGGLILLDEFDNADPDPMVALNSMLSGDNMSVPLRRGLEQAIRNPKVYIVATANTWGNGSGGSAGYVRKQLDSATLDRFVVSKMYFGTDRRITNFVGGRSVDRCKVLKRKLEDGTVGYPQPYATFDPSAVEQEVDKYYEALDYLLELMRSDRRSIRYILGNRAYKQGSRLIRQANFSCWSVLELFLSNWTDAELRKVNITRRLEVGLDFYVYDFNAFIEEGGLNA